MTEMMTMTPPPEPGRKPFRLTGWHVLALVVGFFAVVIGVDTAFTVLALRSAPGEVSATPFEDGLNYNRTLESRRAQAALGWTAEAEAAPGVVRVRFTGRDGRPLEGLRVTGALTRPATAAGERRLAFRQVGPGVYEASAAGARGAWDLTLIARSAAGERLDADRRLDWR